LGYDQKLDVASQPVRRRKQDQNGVEVLAQEVVTDEARLEEPTLRCVPDNLVEKSEVVGVALEGAMPRQRLIDKDRSGKADAKNSDYQPCVLGKQSCEA
jgi:hypothetical protein